MDTDSGACGHSAATHTFDVLPTPFAARCKRMGARLICLSLWPLMAPFAIPVRHLGADRLYVFVSQLLSLVPGELGRWLRASFYGQTLAACAPNVVIGFGARIVDRSTCLGWGVYIGAFSLVNKAVIGNSALVASWSVIGTREREVTLGTQCWIGEAAIVMASVAAHAIVGAGCVVTAPVAAYTTAVGNPMRQLGVRA